MKAINTPAIIEGIRARKDRSLGLTVTTPELSTQEKAIFMELQGININLLITPVDETEPVEDYKVNSDLTEKKPSSRMRAVLFILWKQRNEGFENDFDGYYRLKMERMIEALKSKIEPNI